MLLMLLMDLTFSSRGPENSELFHCDGLDGELVLPRLFGLLADLWVRCCQESLRSHSFSILQAGSNGGCRSCIAIKLKGTDQMAFRRGCSLDSLPSSRIQIE